ncbi:Eukaryotic translation initiation factor 2 subunit beta [Porphyridium purpureum]|uniref:Eukaryotic translation initiation factor 2 subunit beta n=1 Tax=Porphyridium purpureum TaxID=35688 RepID=A0A5J4Z9B4_PORPP|nr:Eukaryotic translation initiation factor 2 subunit beta [Porphyridium purpureum]|eukprot:POR8957..scf295_1
MAGSNEPEILERTNRDAADMDAVAMFDPTAAKKKSKKKKMSKAEEEQVLADQMQAELRIAADSESKAIMMDIPTVNFSGKKRPRKVVEFGDEDALFSTILEEVAGVDATSIVDNAGGSAAKKERIPAPWESSDRDYTYSELLQRAFELMHGTNSTSSGDERKKFRLRAPQVGREGSKKTVFFNFGDICKSIHRQPDHLMAYLGAELGTSSNLQDGGRLVIKGKFQPKGIENVLRRYIKEYVICSSCMSPETVLMRDANSRLYFLQCESCGATRSVTPIKQGFMAQVTRRKT